MKRSLVQIISSALIGLMLITAVGCYGSFPLIQKVHKFNGTLGSKWVNELGFLVMNIIPVYGVAGTVDALILNSIEFWTGKSPMAANDGSGTFVLPQGTVTFNKADNSYTFRQMIDGKEKLVRLTTNNGITTATDENGTVLARTEKNNTGGVTVYDASGQVVSTLTQTQVQSMAALK